jgi:magnesium transporter
MADIVNSPQRPKVEKYEANTLIISQMPILAEGGRLEAEQISLVLGQGYVITFRERAEDIFEPVRRRIRDGLGQLRALGADYLAYALLDRVVDGYFPVVESIGDQIQELETEILERPGSRSVARLHDIRRRLGALRRLLFSQREALHVMLRQDDSPFPEGVRIYLRDVHDHAVHLMEIVESYREMAVALMDIHHSSLTTRLNEVIKVLTIMSSVFAPLTFLAGVYGMNFQHQPEYRIRWAYPIVMASMGAIAGGLLYYFWRRGWIGVRQGKGRRRRRADNGPFAGPVT